jgi:uncharacterized protein (TIGR03435 family)
LAAGLAAAQSPQFEVATIHSATMPSALELAGALRAGTLRLGQQVQGNQASFNLMSLRDLLVVAYGVKPTQVSGPGWLTQQRYNITALMPEGADAKQVPEMLQALLKERFKLAAHKQPVEQQVYTLTVARGGHKMKEAAPPPESSGDEPAGKGGTVVSVGGQQMRINQQPSGAGAAVSISTQGATQKISMGPDGLMHLEVDRFTMAQLADTLTPMMDFPVVDRTDLTGQFQVALDLSMANVLLIAQKAGNVPAGVSLPPQLGGGQGLNAADPGGDLNVAVAKLGLRLEKQKLPLETLIVDSAEQNPTEN